MIKEKLLHLKNNVSQYDRSVLSYKLPVNSQEWASRTSRGLDSKSEGRGIGPAAKFGRAVRQDVRP